MKSSKEMESDKEITVVFAEPALFLLEDDPDLQMMVSDKYRPMVEVPASLRALWALLRGENQKDALKKLVKEGVALKLKELTDYFRERDFDVTQIALSVTTKVGTDILVLSTEATAGVTITITPPPKPGLKKE